VTTRTSAQEYKKNSTVRRKFGGSSPTTDFFTGIAKKKGVY